jgi:hypothetical protein
MHPRVVTSILAAALVALATPSFADLKFEDVHGHLEIGYGKLSTTDAPKGSVSFGTGVDIPIPADLRVGVTFGYHLLGSRTLVQGSLSTGLDYSLIEAVAQLHWSPGSFSPQVRLSGGAGVFVARASLGSSPIGASFSSYAVDETRPGLAFGATVMKRRPAPVRIGFEAAVRFVPLKDDNWTVATARVALAY